MIVNKPTSQWLKIKFCLFVVNCMSIVGWLKVLFSVLTLRPRLTEDSLSETLLVAGNVDFM